MTTVQRIKLAALVWAFIAAVVTGAFWFAGFDFDERGTAALFCYYLSVCVGGLAAFFTYTLTE